VSGGKQVDKVRGEMGLTEKIVRYIPGYRGYKEKEIRRESDRLVRMKVVSKLKTAKDTTRRRIADSLITQKLSSEDTWKIDTFMTRLERVTQRLDRAVAGYAGIFDAVKVREDKLDAVIRCDLKLIERAESLKADVERAFRMDLGKDEWRKTMDDLTAKVEELDKLVDERTEILRGLKE